MMDSERLGEVAVDAIIAGQMVLPDIDMNGRYTGVLIWQGNVHEQLGEAITRAVRKEIGKVTRHADQQAITINHLHDRLSRIKQAKQAKSSEVERLKRDLQDAVWESVDRFATDWTYAEKMENFLSILESVGFRICGKYVPGK